MKSQFLTNSEGKPAWAIIPHESNMTKQVLLITLFLITLCPIATVAFLSDAQADTRYVKEGGTGDGSSWAAASGTLQSMIDAVELAGGGTVCVASGTYNPTTEVGGIGPRYQTFQMKNDVGIYGGFASIGSPTWVDRDWETYKTILSGEIGNPGTITDNCYHVFYHPGSLNLDSTAVLDGFTIAGGNTFIGWPHYSGGGMYNQESSPTIANCIFSNNSAKHDGGGMFNLYSNPSIINCVFSGNSAYAGGGIHNTHTSSPTLTNCTFFDNSAGDGGGMHNTLTSSPILTNCTFSGNSAKYCGGGISNNYSSSPTVTNCTFLGNSTDRDGGGMYNDDSSPTVVNSIFKRNSAINGGGMYNGRTLEVTNCILWGNSASYGGGMYNRYSSPKVTNCILWGDIALSGAEVYDEHKSSSQNITYCNVEGGYSGTGNISEIPMFVNPGSSDFHLLPDSPCINNGTDSVASLPAEDFEGDPRIISGRADMGADESPYTSPLISTGTVTDISDNSAVLHGMLKDLGSAGTLTVTFEYGTNQGGPYPYGSSSQIMNGTGNFEQSIDNLVNGNTYYYRAKAINDTTDWGCEKYFTTVPISENIYVNSGTGSNGDGTSWVQAFENLQDALHYASINDQIWVASGTYYPSLNVGGIGDRYKTFQMKNGVGIYGGFPNTGSPAWNQRDWKTYKTILSGDIGNPGTTTDNCYHVFHHPDGMNLNDTAMLDGFIVVDGNAHGGWRYSNGGGMYNEDSSPTVVNSIFMRNSAINGGGMYNRYSNPILANCTFSENSSVRHGGGIANYYNSAPEITACAFSANSAENEGGGMYNTDSSPKLVNCAFTDNAANWCGGGMQNYYDSSPILTSCTFTGNQAGSGGGISNQKGSSPSLTNCIFFSNTANFTGGGIANTYYSFPIVTNCVLYGNTANNGGGGMFTSDHSSHTVTNCIFWGDTSGTPSKVIDEILTESGMPAVTYSNVQGTYIGTGNIKTDPQWVNPGSQDFHLLPSSPCIDAGTNTAIQTIGITEDFEGDYRILGGTVDMGVYEYGSWDAWDYDSDQDNCISKQEALIAVVDFFGGQITKQQALEVIVLFFAGCSSDLDEIDVHFIDVGQGDAILIDKGTTEILIDGGRQSEEPTDYLQGIVDGPLEVVVATHPHQDHIGGLIAVLNEFDVLKIWHNGEVHTSQTYTDFMTAVGSEGASVNTARTNNEPISVDGLDFHILHPPDVSDPNLNNNSIVLHFQYGDVDFLFTGDAEQEAEAVMLASGNVPSNIEVLKVGHHASNTASSQSFLDVVVPETAIYMCKTGNSYGHPHVETITKLNTIGADIYGTDVNGTIVVTTDGTVYSVDTEY